MKKIAYQGVRGAFSYITAKKEFGSENIFIGVKTFREVFDLLDKRQVDYVVVPIENSLIGSIYENYDFLNSCEAQIVAEHVTKIDHCLLTVPVFDISKEKRLNRVRKVFSHPKALEQCTRFFQRHPWMEAVLHMDTAGAAAEVAAEGNMEYAAIASAQAGKIYGLELLQDNLADDHKNYTRFLIVTNKQLASLKSDKCSLVIKLTHIPGALGAVLTRFSEEQLNITKIESRPLRGSPFEYLFYIDFEFQEEELGNIKDTLALLAIDAHELKILGFYKRGTLCRY